MDSFISHQISVIFEKTFNQLGQFIATSLVETGSEKEHIEPNVVYQHHTLSILNKAFPGIVVWHLGEKCSTWRINDESNEISLSLSPSYKRCSNNLANFTFPFARNSLSITFATNSRFNSGEFTYFWYMWIASNSLFTARSELSSLHMMATKQSFSFLPLINWANMSAYLVTCKNQFHTFHSPLMDDQRDFPVFSTTKALSLDDSAVRRNDKSKMQWSNNARLFGAIGLKIYIKQGLPYLTEWSVLNLVKICWIALKCRQLCKMWRESGAINVLVSPWINVLVWPKFDRPDTPRLKTEFDRSLVPLSLEEPDSPLLDIHTVPL